MNDDANDIADLSPEDRLKPGERAGPGFEAACCPGCGGAFRVPARESGPPLRCPCGSVFSLSDLASPPPPEERTAGPATLMVLGGEPAAGAAVPRTEIRNPPAAGATPADEAPTVPSAAAAAAPPKARFGRYELLGEVARGGMGVVYRARQAGLNREVALKMLLAGEGASEEQVRRFLREAAAAAKLSHPNIVPIYDVGEENGRHYYTMEFIHGESAAQLLERAGRLPARQALRIGRETALALQFAHENGILHRDVKPGNILLVPRAETGGGPAQPGDSLAFATGSHAIGRVLVTDFGLAKEMGSQSVLTVSGATLGTPVYMSPEQAEGDSKALSPRSDVYSLGAVLYELATGKPPFQGASVGQILAQVATREPVPPRRHVPGLHPDVETMILTAMAKEPARRYASARDLAEDLERYLKGEAIRARPASLAYRAGKFVRRNRLLTALAAGLAAVLAGAVTLNVLEARARGRETRERAARLAEGARDLAAQGKFLEAESAFASALAIAPGLAEAEAGAREARLSRLLAQAAELLAEKDYKGAGFLLQEAERASPGRPEVARLSRLQRGTATLAVDGPAGLGAWFVPLPAALPLPPEVLPPPEAGRASALYEELPPVPFEPQDRPFGDGLLVLAEGKAISAFHLPIPRDAAVRVVRKTVRVDPSGAAGPRTVAEALAGAPTGTVIEIPAGSFEGALLVERPGITLRAARGARPELSAAAGPVLKGKGAAGLRVEGLSFRAGTGPVLELLDSPGVQLDGCTAAGGTQDMVILRNCGGSAILGCEVKDGKEAGIKLLQCDRSFVAGNHVHHVGWGGIVAEGYDLRIAGNRVHDNSRGGIFLTRSKYCEVLDNVVERHPEWGISIAEEVRSIKVENNLSADAGHGDTGRRVSGGIVCYKAVACSIRHNTVWRNSRGVEIGQSPESALLDNLIVGSTLVGIHWHEAGAVDHNALWGNRLFAQWIEKPVRNLKEMAEVYAWKGPKMAHGLESDPLLEDPENGNFALKPGSPCRGKASDRRDVGADWARLRLVKEGRYERAAPARHHLVLSFERLAVQAADRGDVEGAKALCRRGLAVVPGHKSLEARLEKLGRPGAGPAAQK